jgi:hypothetical protein
MLRAIAAGVACVFALNVSAQPTRTLVEDARIDGAEHEFTSILDVFPLSNGNVLVVRGGDYWASIFTTSGTLVKNVARKGAGPGEVQQLAAAGLIGDSIWMADRGQNRITLFDRDGGLIRSWPIVPKVDWTKLRPDASASFTPRVMPNLLLPNNRAFGTASTLSSAVANGQVKSTPIVEMDWTGEVSRIVAEVPVSLSTVAFRNGSSTTYTSQPFRSNPILAYSKDGKHLMLITVRESPPAAIRVVRLGANRDTLSATEIPFTPTPISAKTVDSAVKAMATSLGMPEREGDVRAALTIPKNFYPVTQALVGKDGSVWLRGRPSNNQRIWTVVSPAGKVVEILALSSATNILWVDGAIWGVSTDSDDVPSVVRLRRK